MTFEDLYRRLEKRRHPIELVEHTRPEPDADEVRYRLGFASVPLAGMPNELRIGRVDVHRSVGPIATQRVESRQRHGLPITFDKSMQVGTETPRNEVLTVFEISDPPPEEYNAAFRNWRDEALAACGVLAAILDERVAVAERFEDLIFLRAGEPLSSADWHMKVRSFLPFDVTEEELSGLGELATLDLPGVRPLAQAARWYLRATVEGPSADGFVFLWLAVETLTPHKTTSPKTVEGMLLTAGFDPEWLGELSVGRLAGLRADVVHQGVHDDPLIAEGFYRMEAVARVLIRNGAGVTSSWPPALVSTVFGERAKEITRQLGDYEAIWHEGGLPPPDEPVPAGLSWERVTAPRETPDLPMQVTITGELRPGYEQRIHHWLATAAHFLGVPFDPVSVVVGREETVPEEVEVAVNRERIVLQSGLLELPSPEREVRLGFRIQEGLAQMAVMRCGIDSVSMGAALIELAGTWSVWRAYYASGEPFEGEDFTFGEVPPDDLREIGGLVGLALAGSPSAAKAFASWATGNQTDPGLAQIFEALMSEWEGVEDFAGLLAGIDQFARAMQEVPGEEPSGSQPGPRCR